MAHQSGGHAAAVATTAVDDARSCAVMRAARQLADAIDPNGWRVTPSGALSPAEVPAAAAALGLRTRAKVRRAADLPALHRPWLMALATGMVRVGGGRAVATGTGTGTREGGGDDETELSAWFEGLRSICADLSGRKYPETVQWLVMLTLDALAHPPTGGEEPWSDRELYRRVHEALHDWETLWDRIERDRVTTWVAPPYPQGGDWKLFELLVSTGTVQGTVRAPQVTALGRWAAARLHAVAPVRIDADWSAATLLDHLRTADHDDDLWRIAEPWLWARTPAESARELLTAAAGADAATRSAAVHLVWGLGDDAQPAWRDVVDTDDLGPHARHALRGDEEEDAEAELADRWWRAVERAAAALVTAGPDEALSCLADAAKAAPNAGGDAQSLVAAVPGSGHPQAAELTEALDAFIRSGAPRSLDHLIQMTVRLDQWRPTTWRRVLLPATANLGTLSWTIAVLFGWGFDHLHMFRAGKRVYSDPFYPLDDARDEHDGRLSRLFADGIRTMSYTYDLGACWGHEITLERLVPKEPGQPDLRCVEFAGDNPLEYPMVEDYDGEPIDDPVTTRPFRLEKVNEVLASGHYDVDEFDEEFEDEEFDDEDFEEEFEDDALPAEEPS